MVVMANQKPEKERTNFRLPEELLEELRERKDRGDGSMNSIVIRAVRNELSGASRAAGIVDAATEQIRLKYLHRLPCGPLRESLADASDLPISRGMARIFNIDATDFVATAEGVSMMGDKMPEGEIYEDDVLVFQMLDDLVQPRSRQIACVQIIDEQGGVVDCTIKRWHGGSSPYLTDGNGERVEIGEGRYLQPIGVLRTLMRSF